MLGSMPSLESILGQCKEGSQYIEKLVLQRSKTQQGLP